MSDAVDALEDRMSLDRRESGAVAHGSSGLPGSLAGVGDILNLKKEMFFTLRQVHLLGGK